MKKCILSFLVVAMSLVSMPAFSQTAKDTTSNGSDSTLLGLPGDNLNLYEVLDLFLKSKTIEGFEKTLNEQKTGINNLDLDLDKKVDFIKVVTKKNDSNSYSFILQVNVTKDETQDVAVILVDRDKNKKVSVQMVGDKDLYGKDYIIEPKPGGTPAVTANPAYTGSDPVPKSVPAQQTIVVETVPIVQYVYSPAYVPYYPPYYYGYYPPYFAAFTVMAVGIYRANHYYGYHGHGGYHNTVVINNHNHINHYNSNRNTSDRVSHNNANGNYGNRGGGSASTLPTNGASGNRPSTGGPSASTRPANGASGSNRPSNGSSGSSRPSASTRESGGFSGSSSRPSSSNMSSGRSSSMSSGGRSRGGGGGGGGRRR